MAFEESEMTHVAENAELRRMLQINLHHYPKTLREKIPAASKYNTDSGLSELGFDLLEKLLCMDPSQRISAAAALEHPWYESLLPLLGLILN